MPSFLVFFLIFWGLPGSGGKDAARWPETWDSSLILALSFRFQGFCEAYSPCPAGDFSCPLPRCF